MLYCAERTTLTNMCALIASIFCTLSSFPFSFLPCPSHTYFPPLYAYSHQIDSLLSAFSLLRLGSFHIILSPSIILWPNAGSRNQRTDLPSSNWQTMKLKSHHKHIKCNSVRIDDDLSDNVVVTKFMHLTWMNSAQITLNSINVQIANDNIEGYTIT